MLVVAAIFFILLVLAIVAGIVGACRANRSQAAALAELNETREKHLKFACLATAEILRLRYERDCIAGELAEICGDLDSLRALKNAFEHSLNEACDKIGRTDRELDGKRKSLDQTSAALHESRKLNTDRQRKIEVLQRDLTSLRRALKCLSEGYEVFVHDPHDLPIAFERCQQR